MNELLPQAPEIREIVFEENIWHPLDHHIGSAYCRQFQSSGLESIKLHFEYWNDFKKESDFNWYYKATRCLFGRHHYLQWWKSQGKGEPAIALPLKCCWCSRPK